MSDVNEKIGKIEKNYNTSKICNNKICEKCKNSKKLKDFAKVKKLYKSNICVDCYSRFLSDQKSQCYKNINYRFKKSLASKLRAVLVKKTSTMNYVGTNIQYLREWFEYNFTYDMTWNNYGVYWSIGHVIPLCLFDFTVEEEKLKCWNWSNLVPVLNFSTLYDSSKTHIDKEQVENILEKIYKFKEEGSTTKWFSGNVLSKDFINLKLAHFHKI